MVNWEPLRRFQRCRLHVTANGWKVGEKVGDCLSAFQVIEQRLKWHTGAAENRSSPKNLGELDDNPRRGATSLARLPRKTHISAVLRAIQLK